MYSEFNPIFHKEQLSVLYGHTIDKVVTVDKITFTHEDLKNILFVVEIHRSKNCTTVEKRLININQMSSDSL